MIKIAPSIMCGDALNLKTELEQLEASNIDMLHCDVMDGQYVDNLAMGFYLLKAIKNSTSIPLDVHLAVMEPEKYLEELSKIGVDMVSVHVERVKSLHRTIKQIKDLGMKASVALNPSTPACMLKHVVKYMDMALVMTVDPGFEGQKFIPEVADKITEIRELANKQNPKLLIEVDGNINSETVPIAYKAGADTFVLGTSALFKEDEKDYKEKIEAIRALCK